MTLILASQSKQRRRLLESLGVVFEVIPAHIDEKSIVDADPLKRAEKIARAKAEAVLSITETQNRSSCILAADTYVIFGSQILEKPANLEEAKTMLQTQSGQELLEVTGWAWYEPGQVLQTGIVTTTFTFRVLSPTEIEHYISTNPVTEFSAAFSPAYHAGMALIANVNGSFTSFTHGLPLEVVVPKIQKAGIVP